MSRQYLSVELWRTIEQADLLIAMNRYVDAFAILDQAAELAPGSIEILCRLAVVYLRLGYVADAKICTRDAIAIDPESEWAFRLHAHVLMAELNTRDAIEAARESVRIAPTVPETLLTLAEAQRQHAQLPEARRTALRLVELAPAWSAAHEQMARIATDQRDWEEAEHWARKALALNPESDVARSGLGFALAKRGRSLEAIEHFQEAARLNPMQGFAGHHLKQATREYVKFQPWILALILVISLLIGIESPVMMAVMICSMITLSAIRALRRRRLPTFALRITDGNHALPESMSLLTEMLSDGYLIAAFLYFSAWSRTLIRDGVSRSYSLIYFGGVAVIILLFWITYSVIRTQGVEPVETEPDSFDQ